MNDPRAKLPFSVAFRMMMRSAWLQATLHSSGMQKLGRLFALMPIARWLNLDRNGMMLFVQRHLSFFNSNPFVSTLGLGALARIEADAHTEETTPSDEVIERFARRLSTPLGAVGDELFWAAIRPQMTLLAVLIAIFASVWGAIVFVIGFSAIQYAFRWKFLHRGWELGLRVADALRDPTLRKLARFAGLGAAACAGAIIVALLWQMGTHTGHDVGGIEYASFAVALITGFFVTRRGKSAVVALLIGVVLAGVLSISVRMF